MAPRHNKFIEVFLKLLKDEVEKKQRKSYILDDELYDIYEESVEFDKLFGEVIRTNGKL